MKLPCLATLRNLSTRLDHVRDVLSSGTVHVLLWCSRCARKSWRQRCPSSGDLAAASAAGKKAMGEDETASWVLIEVMTWHNTVPCQEHATHLVMVLADGSWALRQKMHDLGVLQALLQVSLLGSSLAQTRAVKILQWFKDDGDERVHGSEANT
jgi:hypothetical protein